MNRGLVGLALALACAGSSLASEARALRHLQAPPPTTVMNGGNNGGPLLDQGGQVLGVTVAGYEINGAPAGVNLFIPIGEALDALGLVVR